MSEHQGFELMVRFYDGRHPIAHVAALRLSAREARVTAETFEQSYIPAALSVSPRIAGAARFIALPGGGELECEDGVWLDGLPQQEPSEGPVAWLERRWWAALCGVVLTASCLTLVYFFALDAVADRLTAVIPVERELGFGERTLRTFDLQGLLTTTQLDRQQTQALGAQFAQIRARVPGGSRFRLEFRNSKTMGPNAFTLPGGIIVVTDQLVDLMGTDEEVIAVLAHELGHAHYRHLLRQAVRTSGMAAITGALLGDASSVAGGLSTAFVLLGTKFSREFERQADDYAAELLTANQLSPALFADALSALDEEQKRLGNIEGYSFLASHPSTPERIARARARVKASATPEE